MTHYHSSDYIRKMKDKDALQPEVQRFKYSHAQRQKRIERENYFKDIPRETVMKSLLMVGVVGVVMLALMFIIKIILYLNSGYKGVEARVTKIMQSADVSFSDQIVAWYLEPGLFIDITMTIIYSIVGDDFLLSNYMF